MLMKYNLTSRRVCECSRIHTDYFCAMYIFWFCIFIFKLYSRRAFVVKKNVLLQCIYYIQYTSYTALCRYIQNWGYCWKSSERGRTHDFIVSTGLDSYFEVEL